MDNSLPHTVPCDPTSPYWVSPFEAFILGILLSEKGMLKPDFGILQKQLEAHTKALEDMRKSFDPQQAILDMPKEQKEQWMLKETLSTLNVCRPHNDPEKE